MVVTVPHTSVLGSHAQMHEQVFVPAFTMVYSHSCAVVQKVVGLADRGQSEPTGTWQSAAYEVSRGRPCFCEEHSSAKDTELTTSSQLSSPA